MKFHLLRSNGALNSPPIFDAFSQGLKKLGLKEENSPYSIPVIWSVLWSGRMAKNREIYYQAKNQNIPVVIIEVGNLYRNTTWRISIDNINSLGYFGNDTNLDIKRTKKFQNLLQKEKKSRKDSILVTTQRHESLQWEGMPPSELWLIDILSKIKDKTDRPIIVRPHPRSRLDISKINASIQHPSKLPGSYDDFDIDYNYHCVVNHCSGPSVHAALAGSPVICDPSSLAYPVSESWENLENPQVKDREQWFINLCHTEWFLDEIAQGIPIKRLLGHLEEKISKIS